MYRSELYYRKRIPSSRYIAVITTTKIKSLVGTNISIFFSSSSSSSCSNSSRFFFLFYKSFTEFSSLPLHSKYCSPFVFLYSHSRFQLKLTAVVMYSEKCRHDKYDAFYNSLYEHFNFKTALSRDINKNSILGPKTFL